MSSDSLVGQHLGPFVVNAELGRGGMGVVYRAYQPSLAREVALKVLPRWFAGQPGFAERFRAEARAAARLHHPNIVTVHDVGEADGWQYIVMQLLRGQTLEATVLQQGPLPVGRALGIANQIASALDYAHREGIVHRDVKPANIIVGDGDQATLTDFGIARIAEQTVQRTMTGTLLGTPEYMAPEQAEGGTITRAADEYALACVLFELLAGRPPFEANTPMAVLMHHMRTPPPRVSLSRAGLPPAVDAVFRRALAKDPTARYASCGELVRAVSDAVQGRAVAVAAPGRPALVAAGIAAAALLVTGVAVFATRGPSAPPAPAGPTIAPVTVTATSPPPTPTPVPPPPTPTTAPVLPTALPATPTSAPTRAPTPTAAPVPVSVNPSGSLVLVQSNTRGGKDLFRVNLPSGSGSTRLTGGTATWNWAPAVSCDGQFLAYSTGSPGASDVAVMRTNGSQQSVIAHVSGMSFGSPWWITNNRVGFNGSSNNIWEIYAVPSSGGSPTQITSTPNIGNTSLPTWPCSSSPLAFVGKTGTLFQVFLQTSNGNYMPISPPNAEGYAPAWAPSGRRLAFQSGSAALNGIVTTDPNGNNLVQVFAPSAGFWARAPAWSPDEQWIAFVSGNSANDLGDVLVVPASGGQPRQITSGASTYDWRLAWLP